MKQPKLTKAQRRGRRSRSYAEHVTDWLARQEDTEATTMLHFDFGPDTLSHVTAEDLDREA